MKNLEDFPASEQNSVLSKQKRTVFIFGLRRLMTRMYIAGKLGAISKQAVIYLDYGQIHRKNYAYRVGRGPYCTTYSYVCTYIAPSLNLVVVCF
jgi:hypothetical protein